MAQYPREIHLDSDTEERLRSYLITELFNHDAERQPFQQDLRNWQKDYWAKPSKEVKNFPFTGASNLVVPLNAIAIEAIHSRTATMLFGGPQFVSTKPVNSDWAEYHRDVERFLDHEMLDSMKIYDPINDFVLETEKFGTGVAKVGYLKVVRRAVRTIGDEEEEFDVTVKDGAVLDAVSMSRIVMPYSAKNPQDAPWVGEIHSDTPYNVRALENSGLFRPGTFQKLEEWVVKDNVGIHQERQFQHNQEELEHRVAQWPKQLDWYELWLGFDVDQSGHDKEIVVHFHRDSGTFLSIRYNWYEDLHRPYRVARYFPVEHRWTGIGICKQNEQFQKEITTIHRQRLDNATLANMRMIKIHKLSGYGPKEPIFPGKMWFLDDMTHVEAVQMAEVYPSSYNNEQGVLIYSQQRTGVNEVTLGMPQVGTPGTATSDLARIQEGNKKFDFYYRNLKTAISEIIADTASEIAQFGPKNVEYFQFANNGDKVLQFFRQPIQLIRNGLLLKFQVAGAQDNKIIDRQNWQQIAAMINQYFVGLFQLSGNNPLLTQLIAQRGLVSATEAMKQILESFDTGNVDKIIIPEFLTIQSLQQYLAGAQAAIANQVNQNANAGLLGAGNDAGGSNGPATISQAPGMGNTSQIVSQS